MNSTERLVLLFVILIITIGQAVDIYLPAMPSMVASLHASAAAIQFTVTAGLIAYGIGAPIYGPLSDYFGRRKIAIIGISIFTVGGILCALAPSVNMLLAGRVIQGLGFASACGVAAPAISDIFVNENIVKAYSYVGMAIAITPVVAPIIGGYLQHFFNWHAPLLFLFFYSGLILLLFMRYFPETKGTLKQSSIHPLAILRDYVTILKNRKYLVFVSCLVLVFAGEISYVITAPFLLQTKLGVTAVQNGWLIFCTVGGYLIGAFISTRLCKIFSMNKLIFMGCIVALIGAMSMLIFALTKNMTIVTVIVPMVIYLLGAGILYPSAIGGCMSCNSEKTGTISSLSATFQQGVGGLVATSVTYFHNVTQLPLAIALVIFAVLALAALYLIRDKATL